MNEIENKNDTSKKGGLSLIDLGQHVPIFNTGSRIYLSMENFCLNSCSLQNIKNGDSLLSENRVVFNFRKLRWQQSSARREF